MATFPTAARFALLWARLGDRCGRKLTLMRASLGMTVAMSLIGRSQNVYQLVGQRPLAGCPAGVALASAAGAWLVARRAA